MTGHTFDYPIVTGLVLLAVLFILCDAAWFAWRAWRGK